MTSKSISVFSPKCYFHISNSVSNNYTWIWPQHLWSLLLWCLSPSPSHFTLIITALVQMLKAFCLGPMKTSLVDSNLTLFERIAYPATKFFFQKYDPDHVLFCFLKTTLYTSPSYKIKPHGIHLCGIQTSFCDKVNQFKLTLIPRDFPGFPTE